MDAHAAEYAAAIDGMTEVYGSRRTAAGTYDGVRRRWEPDDTVAFLINANIRIGHVLEVEHGETRDRYTVRYHEPGQGSLVAEVVDLALLPY